MLILTLVFLLLFLRRLYCQAHIAVKFMPKYYLNIYGNSLETNSIHIAYVRIHAKAGAARLWRLK